MFFTVIVRFPSLNHVEAFSFLNPHNAFVSLLEMIAEGFDARLIRTSERISFEQKAEERVFVSTPAGIVEMRFNDYIPDWQAYRENYLHVMTDANFLKQLGRAFEMAAAEVVMQTIWQREIETDL